MTEGGVVWWCKTSRSTHLLLAYHWHVGQECEQTDLNWRQRANPPFLERDEEREHTDDRGQDIFEHGWLIDIIHYMLGCRFPPFSGINVYFIRDKKIKSTDAPPCGSSSSTTRTTALGSSPLREVEQWWYSACWVLQCMPLTIWHRMDWCMSTEGRLH